MQIHLPNTVEVLWYRKIPKFSDGRKICCTIPKIQTKTPNFRVFRQKYANEIANSEDPDQTAREQSDLGLHYLPRPFCPKTLDHYGMFSCL